ncbi:MULTISPECIES: DUF1802 family protein [unclassified Coleofasciculus]|uniref:DUF1802 family protein n=1 Tax=unclassified Coleofasciculus TaxID=2692782 RepID=UPI00187FE131|nr:MULTISPECIES: DUF1802 family protein [unclassified Coleofasciculus]MBE9129162.1 DUF1802 family protein [Coleofasciculus sp. LEGE 07081]MBE9151827.1 DUF1802 family protein [Coleofasciculus sp. LEGE 07092]
MLQTALCLPAPDIEALIQGRSIAALPRIFVNPGREFALYPSETSSNALPTEQYYRSNFLPAAQKSLAELGSETVVIKAWAKCELCQVLDESEPLDFLSKLTVWTKEALEQTRLQRGHIFLAYLRVYRLPQPVEIPVNPNPRFVPLPQPLTITQATPVLSNTFFEQRCRQMQERQPPQYIELEELQSAIASLSDTNLAAKELDQDIRIFLGWNSSESVGRLDSDLVWIKTIAEVGNSSNGHEFEKLVRKSLLKLGFTNSRNDPKASLDPEATGGAGGLDFYCELPYPVVGECKSTKTERVPDGTPAQLIKLGYKHLQDHFNQCLKLIVAAGELTKPALKTAEGNKISVIRPETLQRLVELQAQHQGSIELLKLKACLQEAYGLADDKIEQYIVQVYQDIAVRSHIVRLVKNYLENTGFERASVDSLHGAYVSSTPPQSLKPQELHEILIELSSPLTGYLGRRKGENWRSDRFYFLRDLPIN